MPVVSKLCLDQVVTANQPGVLPNSLCLFRACFHVPCNDGLGYPSSDKLAYTIQFNLTVMG